MKSKIILSFIALLLVACVRESVQPEENGPKTFDCFTVSMEDSPMTKVHMEDGGAVKWDVGDCIGVYSDTQAPVPYYRGDDGKFYGEKVTGTSFYAFYPYQEDAYDSENPLIITMNFGSWGTLPMVAKSSNNTLCFKQTCGLVRFRLKWDIQAIWCVLSAFSDEALSGRGTIDLGSEAPVLQLDGLSITNGSTYSSTITSKSKDGFWDIYIPLPEGEVSGLNVRFDGYTDFPNSTSAIEVKKHFSSAISILRGEMKTFTLLDIDADFEVDESVFEAERNALIAFYNALNGENWINNTNWCSDEPLNTWYGVETDHAGRVVRLNFSSANRVRGQLPEQIKDLQKLQYIQIPSLGDSETKNLLTGPIPSAIGDLLELRGIDFINNQFEGSLPESMRQLKNLESIDVGGTGLGGPFPEWISELASLRYIWLFNNDFSGELSNSLQNLKYLETFDVGGNNLSGTLPTIVVKNRLDLSNNRFTGSIPSSYVSLLDIPSFNEIDLYNNYLSGPLPNEIVSHPRYHQFAFQFLYNQLGGNKIEVDENHVPARKDIYETLDGGSFNLGEAYGNAELTMIVRWAEWCAPSRGFIPTVMSLADKYSPLGLQTIWAYGGGNEDNRNAYMLESGLDKRSPHIIESYDENSASFKTDKLLWFEFCGYRTPLVELVNKDGCIVFVDDDGSHKGYSFCRPRPQLEAFLSNQLGGDEYLSSDFSADGKVHVLQTASQDVGINAVLMGNAFSDRLIADGTYAGVMQKAMDAFFSEEPYKSNKDLFNVSYVDVVSKNEVYYGETALNTWYGEGTHIGGDDDKVFEYAGKVLTEDEMDDALIIVMINHDNYAGTCYMYSVPDGDYGRGPSISYFPTSSDVTTFNGLVSHEAGGHGFAKLADEYDYPGRIPEEEKESYKSMGSYGWWKNVDFTSESTEVKWAKFITDVRYAPENIGVYEGACTYQYGAWRPTEQSIMRHNIGGFNAPSREAIWYRIHKLAYGAEWEYNYEDFVSWDLAHRTPAATSARSARTNYVEREFEPLAPPVVVNKDWREVVREGKNNR